VALTAIAACLLTLAATPLAAAIARRAGVLDRPGPLKVQTRPVPYLGGLAVAAGLAVGVARGRPALFLPLGLALALGLADDLRHVPPSVRLAAEVAIGVCVAITTHSVIGAAFTIVLINAVNLIDGLDGLASGTALAGAVGFAVAVPGWPRTVGVALAAALAGFLVFNRPPARIYLGDAGAYLIGTAMAALLSGAWHPDRRTAVGVGALLFVAVPVTDMCVAIARRAIAHRPLFQGDRAHVYDQLVDRGLPAVAATLAMIGAQAVFTAVGIAATRASTAAAVTVVGAAVAVVVIAVLAGRFLVPTPTRSA
jgi:UDP-GlcNAc:undecaprenyl-phosphate GlcNAc-1-phosphate transferase